MGVHLGRVRAGAWCLAGALAALAAVFLAAFPAPGLERTTGQIALNAFPAAILGGLASPTGALAGSLVIGLTEALVVGYQSELHVLGDGFGDVAPYAVMLLVLLVRPNGLFGAKERPVSDRIRALLTRRRATLLTVAVLLCLPPFYLDAFWLRIGLFSMAAAIGAVGLALLSGTAGQLSLGHAFFLAVGAYGYTWLAGDPGPGLPTALAVPSRC